MGGNRRIRNIVRNAASSAIAILGGLLLGAVIMLIVGANPFAAYSKMFSKSFFDPYYFAQTLVRSAPIMLSGVAAAVAWRAGYINLGMQGQMCIGGLCATLVALFFPIKSWWVAILCFIAGMAGGMVWALIPAFLDHKFDASLIICTLMMNYATNFLTDYFVSSPIKDTAGDGLAEQSPQIANSLRFYRFSPKSALNTSVFLSIAVVVLVALFLKRSRFGYESKMTGLNKEFARYGGIKSTRMMFATMAMSGALCGFAACVEIFGARYRYVNAMFTSTRYSWTGLMAMLIADYNPIITMVYSVFFAGLAIGGQALQRSAGLPMQIADIIQCCITLFVSVKLALKFDFLDRKPKRKGAREAHDE